MRRFFVIGVLGLLGAFPSAASADGKKSPLKIPAVTRDNFVSLEFSEQLRVFSPSASGNEFRNEVLHLDNHQLCWEVVITQGFSNFGGGFSGGFSGRFGDGTAPFVRRASMSKNQIEAFSKILIAAQLPKIAGNYNDKNSVDADDELLTLTISDSQNRDRKFVIQNRGNFAPRAYFQVVKALRDLQAQKFPDEFATEKFPKNLIVARQNFHSITLETSGGIAGIKSLIEVSVPPMTSSDSSLQLRWSQNRGEQMNERLTTLTKREEAEIFRLLNAANLATLNGKNYTQPGLADGFNETLTLTLNNGHKFIVQNYGDQAPAAYYAITQYLSKLQNKFTEGQKE